MLGSHHDAEECASAALVQVLGKIQKVDNLEAYLVTVTKRRAVDMLRAQERAQRREARYGAHNAVAVDDIADDIAAKAEARWVDALARERLAPHVYEMLRQVADGVPLADVARSRAMTVRQIDGHLLRARATLRAALKGALAALALIGASARRVFTRMAATGGTAVAAACLLCLPFVAAGAGRGPGLVGSHPDLLRSPIKIVTPTSGQLTRTARWTTWRRLSLGARGTARAPRHEEARVDGPAHAGLRVYDSDSGTHEDGPIQMVLACAQNLRVTSTFIGC